MSNAFWKAYELDKNLVEDGVWFNDFEGGARVKMRSPSSIKAREVRRKLEEQEPFRLALRRAQRKKESLPVELEDRLNKLWLAKGVILDWEGVPDRNGNPLPFSPDNCMEVFEGAQVFYEDCLVCATSQEGFRKEESEENQGN